MERKLYVRCVIILTQSNLVLHSVERTGPRSELKVLFLYIVSGAIRKNGLTLLNNQSQCRKSLGSLSMPTRVRKDTSERPVNTTEHLLQDIRPRQCDLGDHWGMRADWVGPPPAGWTQGSISPRPCAVVCFP